MNLLTVVLMYQQVVKFAGRNFENRKACGRMFFPSELQPATLG